MLSSEFDGFLSAVGSSYFMDEEAVNGHHFNDSTAAIELRFLKPNVDALKSIRNLNSTQPRFVSSQSSF